MPTEKRLETYRRAYEIEERRYLRRHPDPDRTFRLGRRVAEFLRYQFLPHYAATPPLWRLLLRRIRGDRPLPDFAVVGPIKSGSSDLVTHLMLHPCVIPPLAKEIFSPEPESWRPFFPTAKERRRVERESGRAVSGYLGPFMHWVHLIDRLHQSCPEARVVVLLRDPVERAFSHWRWDLLLGGEMVDGLPYFRDFGLYVRTALDLFPEAEMYSLSGFPLLQSGIYSKSLGMWIERFGRDQVLVVDAGDYFRDRGGVLHQIQAFLGLPPRDLAGSAPPLNRNPLRGSRMGESARAALREFYAPYNERLFDLIGRRLDWQ